VSNPPSETLSLKIPEMLSQKSFFLSSHLPYYLQTIEQLNSLTTQKLKGADPYFVTQFLRGRAYILIDSVLSMSNPLKTTADQKLVTDLMEAFIDFFVEYLNSLPSLLKEVFFY